MGAKPTTELYFECHITVEPCGDDYAKLEQIGKPFNFKPATFLMSKDDSLVADAFISGRSRDYEDIVERMRGVLKVLATTGYTILRYKIENTLVDTKYRGDSLGLLQWFDREDLLQGDIHHIRQEQIFNAKEG
jgi:hypothetical protein